MCKPGASVSQGCGGPLGTQAAAESMSIKWPPKGSDDVRKMGKGGATEVSLFLRIYFGLWEQHRLLAGSCGFTLVHRRSVAAGGRRAPHTASSLCNLVSC